MHDEHNGSGTAATGVALADADDSFVVALMALRTCSFNSSTAFLEWFDGFLGEKKATMCISPA
jgi:hypothetical protein